MAWPERVKSVKPRGETCFETLFGRCPELNAKLLDLVEFLERYPYRGVWQRVYSRDTYGGEAGRFDDLLIAVRSIYVDRIEKMGVKEVLAEIKSTRQHENFFFKADDAEDSCGLATRLISFDARLFSLSAEDFIGLREGEYVVQDSLGMVRDPRYNLVSVDNDFRLEEQGIVYKGNHVVYYHPFLRRYFTSSFAGAGVCAIRLSRQDDCRLSIAIDPFRSHVGDAVPVIRELDYWYGPKFSEHRLGSAKMDGETVYKRNNRPDLDHVWPVDRIEVRVKNQGHGQTAFTIEELPPPSAEFSYGKNFRLDKFAHFIWDEPSKSFCHLDVAVIAHERSRYGARFDSHFPGKAVASADKVKLVRADGRISIESVRDLIACFFMYDELVDEYFDGL